MTSSQIFLTAFWIIFIGLGFFPIYPPLIDPMGIRCALAQPAQEYSHHPASGSADGAGSNILGGFTPPNRHTPPAFFPLLLVDEYIHPLAALTPSDIVIAAALPDDTGKPNGNDNNNSLTVSTILPPSPGAESPARHRIIEFQSTGVIPLQLRMKSSDSIVFFLNDSPRDLVTLKIDYGAHGRHCASANLLMDNAGIVRSQRPIPYQDFASVCFHDPGDYPFTVYGLSKNPTGIQGTITVEP